MAHLTIFSMKPSAGLLHMARLVITEGFVDDLSQVWSARVPKRIRESLEILETYPELGSTLLPVRMRKTYGESVRRLTVAPFDVIYEFDRGTDCVYVYALVSCRRMR